MNFGYSKLDLALGSGLCPETDRTGCCSGEEEAEEQHNPCLLLRNEDSTVSKNL